MMQMLQATVTHDLQNPISNIDFFVDHMLEACRLNQMDNAVLQHKNIKFSIKLLTSRIGDLLDNNLIQHNSFKPREVVFSPECIVNDMINLHISQLASKGTRIQPFFDLDSV
jgi:K+-sensing histidine kinase KdpD